VKEGVPKADKVNAKTSDYLVLDIAASLVYNPGDNAKIQPTRAVASSSNSSG